MSAVVVASLVMAGVGSPAQAEDPALDVQPDSASVVRGSAVEFDVLANDSGPGGAALVDPVLEILSPPVSGTAEVVDPDGPGGQWPLLRYTPALNAPLSDSLDYQVTDDGLMGTARVSVTVQNAPPTAVDDGAEVNSAPGTTVLIDVLGNDADVDGGVLTVASLSTPGHGLSTLEAGGLRYDPVDDYVGPDTFTYTIGP